MLAKADQILAKVAIADAEANDGNPDDIEEAKKLKAEGDEAKVSGGSEICDTALDKYQEAWEKASESWEGSLSKFTDTELNADSHESLPTHYSLEKN